VPGAAARGRHAADSGSVAHPASSWTHSRVHLRDDACQERRGDSVIRGGRRRPRSGRVPTLSASGAIAAALGAYFVLYPSPASSRSCLLP
jgi:hypothetical protein